MRSPRHRDAHSNHRIELLNGFSDLQRSAVSLHLHPMGRSCPIFLGHARTKLETIGNHQADTYVSRILQVENEARSLLLAQGMRLADRGLSLDILPKAASDIGLK